MVDGTASGFVGLFLSFGVHMELCSSETSCKVFPAVMFLVSGDT